MVNFIISVCSPPVIMFVICWSATIGIGEYFYKSKRIRIIEDLKKHVQKYSETCAKMILLFGFVYISALLLGSMANHIVRWILLVACFIGIMLCFASIAASTEFTMKKLPAQWKGLAMPILAIDAAVLLCVGFGAVWMIKIFASFGL